MGAWSTAIFGGDIACDVRDDYTAFLKEGRSGRAATKQILTDYSDELKDDQDGPVVWLALAVTQWKFGRLEPSIRSRALKIIKAGGDVRFWAEEDQARRRRALEQVKQKLKSPQRAEKKVRVTKPAEPLKKIERLWKAGQVVAFRRDSGRFVLLLTEGVIKNEYVGQIPYFSLLKWQGTRIPPADRICSLRVASFVVGVWPNRKGEPVPWDRVQRLVVMRPPTDQVQIDRDGVFCEEGFEDCEWRELDACLETEMG